MSLLLALQSGTQTFTYAASGGIVFAGAAAVSITHDFLPSGGVVFAGAAQAQYVPSGTVFTYAASGGLALSGEAATSYVAAGPAPPVSGGGGGPWAYFPRARAPSRSTARRPPDPAVFRFAASGGLAFAGHADTSYVDPYVALRTAEDEALALGFAAAGLLVLPAAVVADDHAPLMTYLPTN